MKRLVFLTVMTVVALALIGTVFSPDQAYADRPTPSKQQQSFFWFKSVDAATVVDTFTTPTNSSTELMTFTDADRYNTVTGWYVIEYISFDLGGGGEVPDTTEDSVYVEFFTAESGGTPSKIIYSVKTDVIHVGGAALNADYTFFTLSDSSLIDKTYMRIRSILMDSTAAIVSADGGINYKITVKTQGR